MKKIVHVFILSLILTAAARAGDSKNYKVTSLRGSVGVCIDAGYGANSFGAMGDIVNISMDQNSVEISGVTEPSAAASYRVGKHTIVGPGQGAGSNTTVQEGAFLDENTFRFVSTDTSDSPDPSVGPSFTDTILIRRLGKGYAISSSNPYGGAGYCELNAQQD